MDILIDQEEIVLLSCIERARVCVDSVLVVWAIRDTDGALYTRSKGPNDR